MSQRSVLPSERDRAVLRSFAARIDAADAGAHNNLGVLYYHKGMTEEAVAAFTRALALDPRMQIAERNLRIAYLETGTFERTTAALRERLARNPADHEARRALGDACLLVGDADRAIPELEALVAARPGDAAAVASLARAFQKQGNLEAAARWLNLAQALAPDDPRLPFEAADVAYHRGLNEEAVTRLREVIARVPDHADAHYLLGFVLGDLGRHDEAADATRRALQLNPALGRAQPNLSLENGSAATRRPLASRPAPPEPVSHDHGALAHFNLGLAFRQKGYFSEALREYRLALDHGEDRALVTQAMAEVHLLRQDPAAATPLYDWLVQEQPRSPKLWNERGVALHQAGRLADAIESYERAVDADGAYVLALNNLGVAHFHCGRDDLAIDAFRRALDGQAGFVKARLNLALLLFRRREHALCLEAYRQVLRLEPEHPVAWNGVGLVLNEMRHFEDARNAFARAIDARPDYAEARYNLSFALSNVGDFTGALRETKRALELDPYYVPQKFELAIDFEYESPRVAVSPDLGGDQRPAEGVHEFTLDVRELESFFDRLAPAVATPLRRAATDPASRAFETAASFLAAGELDRAAAEVESALRAGGSRAGGLTLLGEIFLRRGAFGEALERFREARALDDTSRAALAGEVRAHVLLEREGAARELAERLVAVAPDDVDALLLGARVRAATGAPEGALELLEAARRLAPVRAEVQKQIGDVTRQLRDDARAIEAYRHAIALDRDFAAARVDLAALYLEHGATEEAERELVAALAALPTYLDAVLALAALRRSLGRPAETVDLLVAALQRDPWQLDALASLGESLFQCGARSDARVAFARVRRFDPDHVGALYFEGVLYAEERRYDEAVARWDQVIVLEPASEYARRARRDRRTALDLQQIFEAGERRDQIQAPRERRGAA